MAKLAPAEALPLRVPIWIDGGGRPRAALTLSEMGSGYKVLFCFQHWCAGCHSSGFPTLVRLVDAFEGSPHGFAAIQTVFEGEAENTVERLRENQLRYGLRIPFGHDPAVAPDPYSTIMRDYRTNGTPWFIVIDPQGSIVFSDFHLDAASAIGVIRANAP